MASLLHTQEQDLTSSRNILQQLRELLPAGQGYVEVKPNGDIVLSVPAGGGSGSGETYYTEEVTVTTLNQLPNTTLTPKYSSQDFEIITAWGDVYKVETGAYTVNTATKALSIVSSQFAFQVGWKLLYRYAIDTSTPPPLLLPFPSVADNRFTKASTGTLASGVSYICRASFNDSTAWNLFNSESNLDSTFWFGGFFAAGVELWAEIEFSQAVNVGSIDITPMPGYSPKNFRLLVSDTHDANSATYTEVANIVNAAWAGTAPETQNFAIPASLSRRIFRISITETTTSGNTPILYTIVLKP